LEYFKGLFLNIGLRDLIDMTIVAFAFYKIYTLVKETRAEQLIKGIIVLLVATKMSEWLKDNDCRSYCIINSIST